MRWCVLNVFFLICRMKTSKSLSRTLEKRTGKPLLVFYQYVHLEAKSESKTNILMSARFCHVANSIIFPDISWQGRTELQCILRWNKHLDPELVKGPWSKEEDEKVGKWTWNLLLTGNINEVLELSHQRDGLDFSSRNLNKVHVLNPCLKVF